MLVGPQWQEIIAGVAPVPKDQHNVYTSGAGRVAGSGSAAPHDGEAESSQKARERTGTMTLPVHQSAVVEPV